MHPDEFKCSACTDKEKRHRGCVDDIDHERDPWALDFEIDGEKVNRCPVKIPTGEDKILAERSIDVADGLVVLSLTDYNSLSEAELGALRIARSELFKLTRGKS